VPVEYDEEFAIDAVALLMMLSSLCAKYSLGSGGTLGTASARSPLSFPRFPNVWLLPLVPLASAVPVPLMVAIRAASNAASTGTFAQTIHLESQSRRVFQRCPTLCRLNRKKVARLFSLVVINKSAELYSVFNALADANDAKCDSYNDTIEGSNRDTLCSNLHS
jgi:hypothetical protein